MVIAAYLTGGNRTMVYRCPVCRRRISITSRCVFARTRIPLNKLLFCVYLFLLNTRVNATPFFLGYVKNTYIHFKDKIIGSCEYLLDQSIRQLGGPNRNIQIDEMAFRRGQLVSNPTSETENDRDTVWIVGAVEEQTTEERNNGRKHRFIIKVVDNRATETFTTFLRENVRPGSRIKSDGWASYPSAIRHCNVILGLNYTHEVVNHSIGFKNSDGTNTNTIEGFWAHLRQAWRERRGINRARIDYFIIEFSFIKHFIDKEVAETIYSTFKLLLKKIFRNLF